MFRAADSQVHDLLTQEVVTKIVEGQPGKGIPARPIQSPDREQILDQCTTELRRIVSGYWHNLEVPPTTEAQEEALRKFWLKTCNFINAWETLDEAAKDFVLTKFELLYPERYQSLSETVRIENYFGPEKHMEWDAVPKERFSKVVSDQLRMLESMANPETEDLLPFKRHEIPIRYALRQLIYQCFKLWTQTLNRKVSFNHEIPSPFEQFVLDLLGAINEKRSGYVHNILRGMKLNKR
jgi:hypothetical protein